MSRAERIAVVTPRFSETATVGGAETLLKQLALRLARDGRKVDILTTCADDHFTWANSLPPGASPFENLIVRRFPVDARDTARFHRLQQAIGGGAVMTPEDARAYMAHGVNSRALCERIRTEPYDRVLVGPYLFGLTVHAAAVKPERTWLVPCLHDEPFARLEPVRELFASVRGCLFNSEPERSLAERLFDVPESCAVVGMGLDPFEADPAAFARRMKLAAPYVMYSGRREGLKGTPLLCAYLQCFRERTGRDIKLVSTGAGDIEAPTALYPHILDLGFVSEQEKREAMAGAAVFVHPSINESFGIVLLESWLARTPALVHARSEVLRRHCATSGGGLWFRHYPDFEEALIRLLDDSALNRAMGAAGRAYVEQVYAWPSVDRRLFAAIDA